MVRDTSRRRRTGCCQRHGGTATGDGLRMAQALGAATEQRDGQLLRPSAQPRRDDKPQALAAAADRRSRGGRHRDRRRAAGASPTKATAASIFQRHRPPARSAQHHCDFRSGDLGRPARPRPRAAAQSAVAGGWRHPAPGRHARGTRAEDRPRAETTRRRRRALQQSDRTKARSTSSTPPRGGNRAKAWPIKIAPFYAMPLCAAITNTMGGIVVDGDGRVLDTERQADPRPLRRGLDRRRPRWRPALRLCRRTDQERRMGLRAAEAIAGFKA